MATSAITNTIKDASGTAVSGVVVTARLRPGPGFRVGDATEVAGQVATTSNGSGVWTLNLERVANITPTNSYWEIEEDIPEAQGGRKTYAITVGSGNATVYASLLNGLLPAATVPTALTLAAGDARYVAQGALVVNVKDHGALGDNSTDDTAAIAAAVTAAAGAPVVFPPGIYRYTALTFHQLTPVVLLGFGAATLRKTSATGNGLYFQGNGSSDAAAQNHSRIEGLRFDNTVTQTSGSYVVWDHVWHGIITGCYFYQGFSGIRLDTCFNTKIHDATLRGCTGFGIDIMCTSEAWKTIDTYLSDVQIEGTPGNITSQNLRIRSGTSGVYCQNVVCAQGINGIVVTNDNNTAGEPQFLFFNTCLADTSLNSCWLLSAGMSVEMHNCWGNSSAAANGLKVTGGSPIRVVGGKFGANYQHGIWVPFSPSDIAIIGAVVSNNGVALANTWDGIHVDANVTSFQIADCRCINFSPDRGLGTGTQRYGVCVDAGTSDYYTIVNNIASGNATGGVSDGGTGLNKTVTGNLS